MTQVGSIIGTKAEKASFASQLNKEKQQKQATEEREAARMTGRGSASSSRPPKVGGKLGGLGDTSRAQGNRLKNTRDLSADSGMAKEKCNNAKNNSNDSNHKKRKGSVNLQRQRIQVYTRIDT